MRETSFNRETESDSCINCHALHAADASSEQAGATVQFCSVAFTYRSTPVLKDATFSLQAGGFYVLVGSNGAGKSTIVKLLLGQLQPNAGSILLFGKNLKTFSEWNRVGYVSQQAPADYERFPATVFEAVRGGLYASTKLFMPYSHKHKQRTLEILEQVGLSGLEKRLIGELSGGQFQRMLLARALVSQPDLLVLDEATSNLDNESASSLVRMAHSAAQRSNTTVLFVTHDCARLPNLFTATLTLDDGAVTEELHPKEGICFADCDGTCMSDSDNASPATDAHRRLVHV